ncbi:osmoprotectant transport system permease protein [Promicromonospora sp. AC04]|uniref:ABC transporter permease n=1 Tax=Promicromonospora sp. AC04 TaxID=2135723 RepID=UPI000D4226E2|nr:ABC transporter permease subunit [Promicromonospora sp. AC04]PUB29752.1 osmoprotectant transport system permease protein [Promicromonospora sp. AC04]
MNIPGWFLDPAHWTGADSIPVQVGYHLLYSGIALLIALAIAVPLGVYIGYTGRGELLVAGAANALRALPTFGLLVLVVMLVAPHIGSRLAFVGPTIVVLVLLAVPPILSGTVAGIQGADPGAVGAARATGYTRPQILWHVQVPCALPLFLSGVRNATLQIVSTATVAAYVSLNGLGRYIIDGRASSDYTQMAAGAILVAIVALVLELGFLGLGRVIVSPGLTRAAAPTFRRNRTARPGPASAVGPVSPATPVSPSSPREATS